MVVLDFPALKSRALVASKAPKGCYDFDKPENIGNKKKWKKNTAIWRYWKPLEPCLKLKIQLLAKFVHPACDIKFADTHEQLESLLS